MKGHRTKSLTPHVIPRAQHTISRKDISDNALKVLHRLNKAGFEAYLVGGCIRDLLLEQTPKDFDIATDAKPEQVKSLFRNSRIIGRRFRLVHLTFGREVLEVATFRAGNQTPLKGRAETSDTGRIIRDNIYGTIEEDVIRRDFTVNSLYYSIKDFAILDFTGALKDISKRKIQVIGDPETRFREDPVRMIRAVRFAQKLNFDIASETATQIHHLAHLLKEIPPARLFDECNKLFLGGNGLTTFKELCRFELFPCLYPLVAEQLKSSGGAKTEYIIEAAMKGTDARVAKNKAVSPAFLNAAFLWHSVAGFGEEFVKNGEPRIPAYQQAISIVLNRQAQSVSIPKHFTAAMREIWSLQLRFEQRKSRKTVQILEQPRFRAAYDLLVLRAQVGEVEQSVAEWWTKFQTADEQAQLAMLSQASKPAHKSRNKRRRSNSKRIKSAHTTPTSDTNG